MCCAYDYPDGEFPSTLGDAEGEQSIETRGRKNKRDGRQGSPKSRREPRAGYCIGDRII